MRLESYYNYKTIQRSYKFNVVIIVDEARTKNTLYINKEPPPIIMDYHVLGVNTQFYEFKKEVQYYGPFPKPITVLDTDGLELEITFEEDSVGTISKFINWCQRRIITEEGYYIPPDYSYIDTIYVNILDNDDRVIAQQKYSKCRFLRASPINFSYDGQDSVKIQVIFSCDGQELSYIE